MTSVAALRKENRNESFHGDSWERSGLPVFCDWREVFRILPLRYEDRRESTLVSNLRDGEPAFIEARITSVTSKPSKNGRQMTTAVCVDAESGVLHCQFFAFTAYHKKTICNGRRWIFSGTAKNFHGKWSMAQPSLITPVEMGRIMPIYRKKGRYGSSAVQEAILAVHRLVPAEEFDREFAPWKHELLSYLGLPGVRKAFRQLHRPEDLKDVEQAMEVFRALEAADLLSDGGKPGTGTMQDDLDPVMVEASLQADLLSTLPFRLNASQETVWQELRRDLENPESRPGLLLGGVGSGKSVLAYLAALAQALAGRRQVAVLIAPTTILADQLFQGVQSLAEHWDLPVHRIEKPGKRWDLPAHGIWVSTHGLLNQIAKHDLWPQVGLVVFDEEHRFGAETKQVPEGVRQLFMSATPIPASLAQIRFQKYQIYRLASRERDVRTRALPRSEARAAVADVGRVLAAGGKAMVVYGTIEQESTVKERMERKVAIYAQGLGKDQITVIEDAISPKAALEMAKQLSDGARKPLLRLDRKSDFPAMVAKTVEKLGMFAFPLYVYDKDNGDRVVVLKKEDVFGTGKTQSASTLLDRCRDSCYESIPLLRESAIRQGKDLQSTLPFWEKQFPSKVVVLTGRMKGEEKKEALASYASGACPILVCTTIVEVGVDIDGTDLLVVAQAEKLGIASLVQLRGRVGRHGTPGTCLVIGPDDDDTLERLEHFAQETDDEKLAWMDFYERGFGTLCGKEQSGNTSKLFRLPRDKDLFERIVPFFSV